MINLGQNPWKGVQDFGLEIASEGIVPPGAAHKCPSLILRSVALEGERKGDFAGGARRLTIGEKGAHDHRRLAGHKQRLFSAAG